MKSRTHFRMVFTLALVALAVILAGRLVVGQGVLAQAKATPTVAATPTGTVAATTAATTAATATATTAATTAATAAVTAPVAATEAPAMTPTAEPTTGPTAAATLARPTPVRSTQPAQPVTRTITFSGVVEMPPAAPAGSMARTITVVGEGRVRQAPDTATTIVGVETISNTVRAAADENARIMTAVMAALRNQGVAQGDAQTTGLSVYTERQPAPQAGQPDRMLYHVTNNVTITVRQINNLSALLDAAITAGANSVSGVSFTVGDAAPLMAQAREAAIADALARATALAGLTGVQLGEVVQVSENIAAGGIPLAARQDLGGGGLGPVSPGQVEIVDQVQVTYAIQ